MFPSPAGETLFPCPGRQGVRRSSMWEAAHLRSACSGRAPHLAFRGLPCEEEQHVGSSASAQTPVLDGLQRLAFRGLPGEEQHVAELAFAQTRQEPDVSSLKELLDATTLEELFIAATSSPSPQDTIEVSPPSGRSLSSSPIWVRKATGWGIKFYTIKELRGSFRTYPHVGGPFQSLDEAYNAIDRYLDDHRDPTMGLELSQKDKFMRQCLYYLDGTRKKRSKSEPIDERRVPMRQLVQALVDKYNDFHNLLGDLAHELKDVVRYESLWDGPNYTHYYHVNFTTKTKGADDLDTGSDNLFFAEVKSLPGRSELVVNCCCMVKPFYEGYCYGCQNDMKHPNGADAYVAGRSKSTCSNPYGVPKMTQSESDSYHSFEAEEARVRFQLTVFDDPNYEKRMRALMAPFKL